MEAIHPVSSPRHLVACMLTSAVSTPTPVLVCFLYTELTQFCLRVISALSVDFDVIQVIVVILAPKKRTEFLPLTPIVISYRASFLSRSECHSAL